MAVESTFNWYWLVDGLQAKKFPVTLVNTSAIQQYEGLKCSDDYDAWWLAHMMRLGILPKGYIYPRQNRATVQCATCCGNERRWSGNERRTF